MTATASPSTAQFTPPGSDAVLTFERDASGRLERICSGERVYVETDVDARIYDDLAAVSEAATPNGLIRRVEGATKRWVEEYRWDDSGRLAWIDGVEVRRDERGRVVACVGPSVAWQYGYLADDLCVIDGPAGRRSITCGRDGRPVRIRDASGARDLHYSADGHRLANRRSPRRWHRDAAGRLWTVSGANGEIVATFLWDGFACLGRIDGPPGQPLAAYFCLDPSGTPVRVVERDRVVRIPRDAFGESLLAHTGVPGLYSGAVHDGFVHLPNRVLDPVAGAFCSPDPWNGSTRDPRRGAGYCGPLPIEPASSGPYAVCRNDPVGRADPTGAVSGWLVLSDFTWSLQNNLVSFFGLDYWFSLLLSPITAALGNSPFSTDGIASTRLGSYGIRRDGILAVMTGGRAFTTQHLVWAPAHEFDDLLDGRVIDPAAEFRPTLYGSILLARPRDVDPFLLRGMAMPADVGGGALPVNWSRNGGPAERVVPGSLVPAFPRGGLHLDSVLTGVRGPRPCPVRELVPAGPPSTGTFDERILVTLPDSVAAPTVGDLIWLADGAGVMAITTIVSVSRIAGSFLVRLEAEAPGLGPGGVRMRKLVGAAAAIDARPPAGAVPGNVAFDAHGAAAAYTVGDLVRVIGPPDTVALVTRLEARVRLDAPVPGTLTQPLTVTAATAGGPSVEGAAIGGDASVIVFTAAAIRPTPGQTILVSAAGVAAGIAVVVGDAVGANGLRVDRDLAALGASGTAVRWRAIIAGAPLGSRADAPEPDPVLTYLPTGSGLAPAADFVRIDSPSGVGVRSVSALDYDAVVLGAALPPGAGPFGIERYVTEVGGTDASSLTIARGVALVAQPDLPDSTEALLLMRLTGPTVAAGPAIATATTVAAATASGVARDPAPVPPIAPGSTPRPSQLVVLQRGADSELAVVQDVRVSVTFDRDLAVGAGPVEVVLLGDSGPTYRAIRLGPSRISVRPVAIAGAANVDVELPRFLAGESIHLVWNGGEAWLRVAAVEGTGTTCDLDGGGPLPDPTPALRVIRLAPTDPSTGSSRIGRDATPVAGAANQMQIAVWQPDAFPPDRVVGIATGDRTLPARVTNVRQDLAVRFTSVPVMQGAGIDICAAPLEAAATGYCARFVRDGRTITVFDAPAGLVSGPNLTVVVPFSPSGVEAASAVLHCGTVLHPQDPEGSEVDRRQSLVDHELTHTVQYARLGPWWFGYFPLWAVELGIELGTDIEKPEYSPYVPGTVEGAAGGRVLDIPDRRGIPFATDDEVQLTSGGTPVLVKLGRAQSDGKFLILRDSAQIATGSVQLRRHSPSITWGSGILNALQLTTHGGLLNATVGTTWAATIFGIGKLFYALGRAIFGTGKTYPATVGTDGTVLALTTPEGRTALASASRIVVRKGDDTVVRSSTVSDATIRLDARVTFTDAVEVAPYDSHDPGSAWDWHSYHPAHRPDPSRPGAIVIDDDLQLDAFDRVTMTTGEHSKRATVTTASGNNIELTEGPDLRGDETTFRIAKVDERDPFGNADSMAMQELGMGWMRWIFDPYGQIQMRAQPENTGLSVFLHSLRYLFGTKSWSLLPMFGYVWYERLFHSDTQNAHRAAIEQEASEESGDLYSPVGRLRGTLTHVGDVARYWYFPLGRDSSFVTTGNQDAPGVHLDADEIRICPLVDPAGAGAAADPNGTAETPAGAAAPGTAVPDALAAKPANDPTSTSDTNPRGLNIAGRGFVPTSAILERTLGGYVAFTRPGSHRVTTRNGISGAREARDLHERDTPGALEFWAQHGTQTLYFDVTIADVDLKIAGNSVAPDAAAPVELVVGQRAAVTVEPGGDRVYALSVRQPRTSNVLRTDGMVLVAQGGGTGEVAEVSRLYAGGNPGGGFASHGLQLDNDLHVPVRRFTVDVVTTVPMRATAEATAPAVPTFRAGEVGFVVVPAPISRALRFATVNGGAPAAGDPQPTIEIEAVPEAVRLFVGDGGVFRVTFPAAAPAAAQALVFEVQVTIDGGASPLTCSVEFAP